ncbi:MULTISPECIES: hypothetical protein [Bacillati]|uniref:hypothetical protein n=1 Tax=Bacillati TaxID=1783272 RepID=UPI0022B9A56D|nr:hypothetical protein [Caldifermentibacillus hisashii]
MLLTIIHVLVHLYYFLEQYVYIRIQEDKIRQYARFCEELTHLNRDEECKTEELNSSSNSTMESTVVTLDELDEEANSLLNEVQAALDEDFMDDYNHIHIDDFADETNFKPTGFEIFASAKIDDQKQGPQQWVVTVIGMEDTYIHVTDGKRIWVNIGEKVKKISNNDVLILDVIRKEKDIIVQNIFQLDTEVSSDYSIPDEDNFHQDLAI